MMQKRARLGADDRVLAARAAAARLVALPEMRGAAAGGRCIAGFVATRGEIDPAGVLEQMRGHGVPVALPRVWDGGGAGGAGGGGNVGNAGDGGGGGAVGTVAGEPVGRGAESPESVHAVAQVLSAPSGKHGPRLRFHLAASTDLRPGAFGIAEPDPSCPEVDTRDIAVMIVPGLAFDVAGNRLGFGGGYYDELLAGSGTGGRPAFVVGLGYEFQVVDTVPVDARDARLDCLVTDVRVVRCAGAPGPATAGPHAGGPSDEGSTS